MVGLIDIGMVFAVIAVMVYLTKQKECDACCGRVKDETVGHRRRESVARDAEERRSRMESAEVTSFGNPSWGVNKANDAGEWSIEMTTRTNASARGEQKVTGSITSFTNPRLDATTVSNTQELSTEMTAPSPNISDSPLPNGWSAHEAEDGQLFYEQLSSGLKQWERPSTDTSIPPQHHTRDSTKLPPNWDKHNDEEGQRYYFNNRTQESSWVAPDGSTGGGSGSITNTCK